MSFSPVLGRSSAVASVWTRSLYSRVDVHRDDRVAVLELDLADVADAHAGDAHGLALARRDGLRGRELGLELERLALPREAQPLVVEDVAADAARRSTTSPMIAREVAGVLADRGHCLAFAELLDSRGAGHCRRPSACREALAP